MERHFACLFMFFFYVGSYTPTKPGNSWAVTHAGAGLTGLLWEAAAFGSWGRLFAKGLTPQGQRVFSLAVYLFYL